MNINFVKRDFVKVKITLIHLFFTDLVKLASKDGGKDYGGIILVYQSFREIRI